MDALLGVLESEMERENVRGRPRCCSDELLLLAAPPSEEELFSPSRFVGDFNGILLQLEIKGARALCFLRVEPM